MTPRIILSAALAALLASSANSQAGGAAAAPRVVQTQNGPVRIEALAALEEPWALAYLPDGRLLVTEKPGRLRIFGNGRLSDPVGGVPAVAYLGQGGLLGVAVDPAFDRNHLIYLAYAEAAAVQPADAHETDEPRFGGFLDMKDTAVKGLAVARARLDGNRLQDLQVIYRQEPKTIGRGHFGGRMAFAPDGTLFITSSERQRFDPAQDPSGNLGKTVRINSDGSIPNDNPFVNAKGTRPEIWSLGHRNILGIAFQPGTGRLWEAEMGPKGGDEFNLIERGANYGWPIVSEGSHYNDAAIPKHATHPEFKPPVRSWTPTISPSSLAFYSGTRFPAWQGNAFIGGLSGQALIRLTLSGTQVTGEERIGWGKRVRDVVQAPDGSLTVITDGKDAELLRLTPAS
ncbi:MAG: PQQ-dependent sugar dehydrogenase [Sphingomonadales bacterium]